jgi:NDP-sugar pyrophosphorylase family protein
MENVVAMVFCGGSGTRLRPLSYLIRKEMLPIGRSRKPVLEFIVNHLRRQGIRDIVFLP